MRLIKEESGFIFSTYSIVSVFIIAMTMDFLITSLAVNTSSAADNIASSQAYWNSISGLQLKLRSILDDGDLTSIISNDFQIDVDDQDSIIYITSNGINGGFSRTTTLSVSRNITDIFQGGLGSSYLDPSGNTAFEIVADSDVQWWITDDSTFFSHDILSDSDGAFFVAGGPGGHLKKGMTINFPTVANTSGILSMSLGGAKDAGKPLSFSSSDILKIYINDELLEEFKGGKKNGPLYPQLGETDQNIIADFQNFTFEVGDSDSIQVSFEIDLGENLYLGIDDVILEDPNLSQMTPVVNSIREI